MTDKLKEAGENEGMDRRGFYFCHILYKKGRKELKGVAKNKREKGRKNIVGLLIQLMEVRKASKETQNSRLQEQSIFGRGEFGGGLAWPL